MDDHLSIQDVVVVTPFNILFTLFAFTCGFNLKNDSFECIFSLSEATSSLSENELVKRISRLKSASLGRTMHFQEAGRQAG